MRNMTVGELVYKQAIENGYDPEKASGVLSPIAENMRRSLESYQNVIKDMEAPLRMVNSAVESIRPQLDFLNNIKIPELPKMPELPQMSMPVSELLEDYYIKPQDRIQKVEVINPILSPVVSEEKETEFILPTYHLPKGSTWESLSIKFLDGHFVRVSYPRLKTRKFDFKDMGFLNGKTLRPDKKWALLYAIACSGGALTNEKWDRKFGRNVKYELNEKLKKFFGMDTPPIPHYTKKRGYEVLFTIKSDK